MEYIYGMHMNSFASCVRGLRFLTTSLCNCRILEIHMFFFNRESGRSCVHMCWRKRPIKMFKTFNFKENAKTATLKILAGRNLH